MRRETLTHSSARWCAALAAAVLALCVLPARAQDIVRLAAGIDYSRGDYGTETSTDILYLPFSATFQAKRTSVKLTVPFLRITTRGGVVGGGDSIVVGEASGIRRTESGLGDVTLAVSHELLQGDAHRPWIDITGKIKLPTADETKGLGTGETDFAFEADLTQSAGASTLFATLGYRMFGDPEDVELENVFYGTLGVALRLRPDTTVGAMYDTREATSAGAEGMSEVTGYLSRRLAGGRRLLGYFVLGLSDGSPDWAVGVTVSTRQPAERLRRLLPFGRRRAP